MLDFNEPVIADKSRADEILQRMDFRSSDYCFGNMFIWRGRFKVRIAFVEGFIIVKLENYGRTFYLYPAGEGDTESILNEMYKDALESGNPFALAGVTPVMRERLEEIFPGKFIFTEDRNNFDYIYNSEDLIGLRGKKYHSKRNHITRFMSLGEWSYEPINAKNLPECVAMNDEWCRINGCAQDKGLSQEYCAVREAAKNFEALGFDGGLLRLYGKVVAFTMGERLCADTYDVHIEKAFSDVEGAYTVINNEFVTRCCSDFRYVNREEDTGDEGLRKAKLSYQPAILLEKYYAALPEGVLL